MMQQNRIVYDVPHFISQDALVTCRLPAEAALSTTAYTRRRRFHGRTGSGVPSVESLFFLVEQIAARGSQRVSLPIPGKPLARSAKGE